MTVNQNQNFNIAIYVKIRIRSEFSTSTVHMDVTGGKGDDWSNVNIYIKKLKASIGTGSIVDYGKTGTRSEYITFGLDMDVINIQLFIEHENMMNDQGFILTGQQEDW